MACLAAVGLHLFTANTPGAPDADANPPDIEIISPEWRLFDQQGDVARRLNAERLQHWSGQPAILIEPRLQLRDAAQRDWRATARLGRLLEELPNVYVEVGAVLYDLGRQPRTARDFFVRFQDRILFGKDSFQPAEYPYYSRVFETADDYFDYYRDYHASWKLYGLDLPDHVLKKVYHENALGITACLPQHGWER